MPITKNDEFHIDRIRKLDVEGVYSDVWTCPECGRGDMVSASDDYEACESSDKVVCEECAHECELRQILFVRGDISTLLEAMDDATAELKALRRRIKDGVDRYSWHPVCC